MTKKETGAPANAKLLEQHAADAEQQVTRTRTTISDIIAELPKHDGNDVKQQTMRDELNTLHARLIKEYDLWIKLSKQVLDFDKAVSEQRRDGEKVSRIDVEEYFRQFMLSLDLAIESHAITIAQEACRAESPTEFLRATHEGWLACKQAQIDAAIRDGRLPEWANV